MIDLDADWSEVWAMDVTQSLIVEWAHERNLIEGSTPQAQMLKLIEEVGELAHAIARGEQKQDAIGDCAVVLTIIAEQCELSLGGCMRAAYEEIRDRKGRMVNGVFIKEVEP